MFIYQGRQTSSHIDCDFKREYIGRSKKAGLYKQNKYHGVNKYVYIVWRKQRSLDNSSK
jgi:hypothetical protein